MLVDHSGMKLGRLPYVYDPTTPKLGTFLTRSVFPRVPDTFKWSPYIKNWPVLANDTTSDCTLAGILHLRQLWRAAAGITYTPTAAEALELYGRLGYDPSKTDASGYNPTDTGEVESDVLKYCRNTGFADGTKISAFLELQRGNAMHLKYAIWQLGGAYLGVSLPLSAQTQEVWDVVRGPQNIVAPNSWGGHCVVGVDFDLRGIWVVSWGKLILVTWRFWTAYFEENWGIVSSDFLNRQGKTPLGLNLAGLGAALDVAA
jgi:hypothetical protein